MTRDTTDGLAFEKQPSIYILELMFLNIIFILT